MTGQSTEAPASGGAETGALVGSRPTTNTVARPADTLARALETHRTILGSVSL